MRRDASSPGWTPFHSVRPGRRIAPFGLVAALAFATVPLGPQPRSWLAVAAAAVLTCAVVGAAVFVPWKDVPRWLQVVPPLAFLVAVALLRGGQGGLESGHTALLALPVVWIALYGRLLHVLVVVAALAPTALAPALLAGEPVSANEWRRALVWTAVAAVVALATARLVEEVRRRAEEAARLAASLAEQESRFRRLAEASRDVVIRLGRTGLYEYASPAARDVLGWEPEELVGRSAWELVHPDDAPALRARGLDDPEHGPDVAVSSFRARRSDGTYAWVEGHRVTLRDEGGRVTGYQSTIRDVGERHRLEAEHRLAERRFHEAFTNAPIGLSLVGVDGRWLAVNDALCRIAGYDREALLARTFQDITHPDDLEEDLNLVRQVLLGERETFTMRKRYVRPDGALVPVQLYVSLVRDDDGRPLYFVSQVVDLSELEAATLRAQESDRRYKALLHGAPVGIYETDRDGACLYVNAAWCELSGLSAEEALGDGWAQALHPDDRERVSEAWGRFVAGDEPFDCEYRFLRPDGAVTWVAGRASALRDALGGPAGHLGTVQDVSERRAAEAALRESEEHLSAVAAAVRELGTTRDARQSLCEAAGRLASADVVALVEPDDAGRLVVTGSTVPAFLGREIPSGASPSGCAVAFRSGARLLVGDARVNPVVSQAFAAAAGVETVLFEPVLVGASAVAVLASGWARPQEAVSPSSINVLAVFAAEAAAVIERADLFGRLDVLARQDALTGIDNRRVWDEEIDREVARAARSREPLAVALLDLDHFKAYNDAHGHQAGDRLLKAAAGAWSSALRGADRLARYGGEEFALALPGCTRQEALAIVERLRSLVPEEQTCSIGLAEWDGRESADSLTRRADLALYDAKRGGRDRVVLA